MTHELVYSDFSTSKISESSISHSLSQIETSLSRFLDWKSSALSDSATPQQIRSELPLYDLDTALNQLDLIITLKPSILSGNETKFALLLAQAALPLVGSWIWYEDEFSQSSPKWNKQEQFTQKALPLVLVVSLHYLSFLTSNIAEPINDEDANGRFALVATSSCYLYHGYPWSDSLPTSIHNQLESIAHDAFQKYPQYIDQLYSDLIKPVFVKAASHPDVSTAGRKIFRGDHGELERLSHTFSMFFMDDSDSKDAWKTSRPHSIALLETYLHKCPIISATKVQSQWSFFVPCILNILDYHEPAYKRKGSDLLSTLIDSVAPHFFKNTGVFSVFWDALKPALTFIPPSTPAVISVPLSQSVFEAMMKLSYLSMPRNKTNDNSPGTKTSFALQEEYLLGGVFKGVSQSYRSIPMMIQLLKATNVLLSEHLKIYATPYTKNLVAIITGCLGDPFIVYSTELMTEVLNLLKTLIRTLWFRIPYYRYDILRGIISAAKKIDEQLNAEADHKMEVDNDKNPNYNSSSGLGEIRNELSTSIELLIESVQLCRLQNQENGLDLSSFSSEIDQLKVKEPAFGAFLTEGV